MKKRKLNRALKQISIKLLAMNKEELEKEIIRQNNSDIYNILMESGFAEVHSDY